MYRTGVYFGRFCPPHRGHLYQIIEASTQCQKLVVIISDNANQTREICQSARLPYISYQLRKQWISQQIQDMEHILVRVLDETDIPEYPNGWTEWSQRMRTLMPEGIDAFFVGDLEYHDTLAANFPGREQRPGTWSRTKIQNSVTWSKQVEPCVHFFELID